jgi:hypothetical protein
MLWVASIFYIISIGCSLLYHFGYKTNITLLLHLNKGLIVTYGIGLLAAWVVYSQILSLRKQLQVQSLIEYSKMWYSSEMTAKRKNAMAVLKLDNVTPETVELDKLEYVLELMEDFSTLSDAGVLDRKLLWDCSLGWYANRYYYYSKNNNSIQAIRAKWGLPYKPDISYYEMLDKLHNRYLDNEIKIRNITRDEVKLGYNKDKSKFVCSEDADAYYDKNFREVLIELRHSKINGVGVFAVSDIKKGCVFAEGLNINGYNRLVPWESIESLDESIKKKITDFCIGTPEGFIPPKDFDFNKLTIEWYMNHSCNGNVGFNENGDFEAIIDIEKGTELTYDYGLAESNPKFKITSCNCKSSNCRHLITGNDWKNPDFRNKNLNHMLPKLRVAQKQG